MEKNIKENIKENTTEKTFVLASKNSNKAKEIQQILGEKYCVITQTDAGAGNIDVVEDGSTFEENAVKKAEEIMHALNRPTIADDSGLCVEFLNGAPGVYTARYAGENATDEENITKLLTALKDVTFDKRTAKFVCTIALAIPGRETVTFRGECEGKIAFKPEGKSGFGYDPVFYVDKYACTMAQLESHIKNAISHRFKALCGLAEYLKTEN